MAKIMTNTLYNCRFSESRLGPVLVLGYLGSGSWQVYDIDARKESVAKTSKLSVPDPRTPDRIEPQDARKIRLNDPKPKATTTPKAKVRREPARPILRVVG